MNKKTVDYAVKHMNVTAEENGIRVCNDPSSLKVFIETKSGKNYQIADAEILYQAKEFLVSELEEIKTQ